MQLHISYGNQSTSKKKTEKENKNRLKCIFNDECTAIHVTTYIFGIEEIYRIFHLKIHFFCMRYDMVSILLYFTISKYENIENVIQIRVESISFC